MKRNAKIFCAALALVLVFGAVVGGTLAWLIDFTEPIKNTFTVGNVNIDLTEADGSVTAGGSAEFKMVPGETIAKDPKVTVEAGSEACWLFVKVEESENLDDFITYGIAAGWTELAGENGVYYREVGANTQAAQEFSVLAGDQVTVLDSVTKEMMDGLADVDATQPTLTFTAYAVQSAGFATAADAWDEFNA